MQYRKQNFYLFFHIITTTCKVRQDYKFNILRQGKYFSNEKDINKKIDSIFIVNKYNRMLQ